MDLNTLTIISLVSPVLFVMTSIFRFSRLENKLHVIKKLSLFSSLIGITSAIILGIVLLNQNISEFSLFNIYGLGISFRFDTLSVIMLNMISILSFVVLKFSHNYLEGDQRHDVFIARLSATIASVQLLVISGNLAILLISWVLTSVSLQQLLLFYNDRPRARIAAKKKFIVARLGDLCLLTAFMLLYAEFETGNLEAIFQKINISFATENTSVFIELSAILIGASAILKSAQFPLHGWLVEVMETPTPVSALLHAGLLNAGPFIIIRMAFIMEASSYASMLLIIIGSITALFASIVFLTQTSIKTALGYSSIAHMGFSLFVCGLGLYSAALLHLVAHSFYKAHAFLSSGSAIEVIRHSKFSTPNRLGNPFRIILGIIVGIGLYFFSAWTWNVNINENIYLFIVGGIIAMGLSRLFTSSFDSKGSFNSIIQISILSILVTSSFFLLESAFNTILSNQIPVQNKHSFTELLTVFLITITFAIVVLIQIFTPIISESSKTQKWAIHFKNGLYLNALFDKFVGTIYEKDADTPSLLENQKKLIQKKTHKSQKLEKQFS